LRKSEEKRNKFYYYEKIMKNESVELYLISQRPVKNNKIILHKLIGDEKQKKKMHFSKKLCLQK
jgi:hypothetical protein